MLRTMRNQARTHTRLLLGVFVGLWLSAAVMPCVMAASACDHLTSTCHETPSSGAEAPAPCEQATPDCAAPDTNTPVSALYDFTPAPAFIITLPAGVLAPVIAFPLAVTQPRARPPHTPIYLEHLALLN